jgi:hypothetical protein
LRRRVRPECPLATYVATLHLARAVTSGQGRVKERVENSRKWRIRS